jgi:hypothetical protein
MTDDRGADPIGAAEGGGLAESEGGGPGASRGDGAGTSAEEAVGGRPRPDATRAEASAGVGRRSFVRALAGDGVTTAGKLAGMSGMLAGSMMAAVRAAGDEFAALGGSPAPAPPAVRPKRPTLPPAPTPAGPAVPLRLAEADQAVLESVTIGLLATNQPNAAPAMGVVRCWWDGATFRIPGRSDTARTANLQRDPFASLTIIDPLTGDALLIAGRTRLSYGPDGRDGVAVVLEALGMPRDEGWDAPDGRGAPILVVLEPLRLIRRSATDERP